MCGNKKKGGHPPFSLGTRGQHTGVVPHCGCKADSQVRLKLASKLLGLVLISGTAQQCKSGPEVGLVLLGQVAPL